MLYYVNRDIAEKVISFYVDTNAINQWSRLCIAKCTAFNNMYKTIREFYNSTAWKKTREAYKSSKQGLCERCLAKGLINPCEEVHHKVRLTTENINDASISLNYSNLECLCTECHEKEHEDDARHRWMKWKKPRSKGRRYFIDKVTGKVIEKNEDDLNDTLPS